MAPSQRRQQTLCLVLFLSFSTPTISRRFPNFNHLGPKSLLSSSSAASSESALRPLEEEEGNYGSTAAITTGTTPTMTRKSKQKQNVSNRKPCRFFLWNAVSAYRYHLCRELLRDNIYEGRGGKKFVRIKPGSILESLYPCSQHSPSACAICGSSFHDHLLAWWWPNLHTPYDKLMNSVYQNGCTTRGKDDEQIYRDIEKKIDDVHNRHRTGFEHVSKFIFHRAYVEELTPNDKLPIPRTQGPKKHNDYNNDHHKNIKSSLKNKRRRQRRERQTFQESDTMIERKLWSLGLTYRVPRWKPNRNDADGNDGDGSVPSWNDIGVRMARTIVLNRIDALLRLESRENVKEMIQSYH